MLAAERIGVGALLDLVPRVAVRHATRPGVPSRLLNPAAFGGGKKLAQAPAGDRRLGQRHPLYAAQLRVNFEQKIKSLIDWNGEGINLNRRRPLRLVLLLGSQGDVALLYQRRSASDLHGPGGRGLDALRCEPVRGRESPCPGSNHADAQAETLRRRSLTDSAVFRGNQPFRRFDQSNVSIGSSRLD